MKIIDADKLHYKQVYIQTEKGLRPALVVFAKEIRKMPEIPKLKVQVDPVMYGDWTSSQGLAEVGEAQCSNCKTIYYADDLYNVGETDENGIGQALMPNYCPHCGAKNGWGGR